MELDDAVHGFSATVVCSARREVGEERAVPAAQGPSEAGDFRDRAGVERREDLLGQATALGQISDPVGGPQLLGALPGEEHFLVGFIGLDRSDQAGLLLVGEVLGAGAQDGLDAEQRVALATAVAGCVALQSCGGRSVTRRCVQDPW